MGAFGREIFRIDRPSDRRYFIVSDELLHFLRSGNEGLFVVASRSGLVCHVPITFTIYAGGAWRLQFRCLDDLVSSDCVGILRPGRFKLSQGNNRDSCRSATVACAFVGVNATYAKYRLIFSRVSTVYFVAKWFTPCASGISDEAGQDGQLTCFVGDAVNVQG